MPSNFHERSRHKQIKLDSIMFAIIPSVFEHKDSLILKLQFASKIP
jgi:hypothetical protein